MLLYLASLKMVPGWLPILLLSHGIVLSSVRSVLQFHLDHLCAWRKTVLRLQLLRDDMTNEDVIYCFSLSHLLPINPDGEYDDFSKKFLHIPNLKQRLSRTPNDTSRWVVPGMQKVSYPKSPKLKHIWTRSSTSALFRKQKLMKYLTPTTIIRQCYS